MGIFGYYYCTQRASESLNSHVSQFNHRARSHAFATNSERLKPLAKCNRGEMRREGQVPGHDVTVRVYTEKPASTRETPGITLATSLMADQLAHN